MSLPENINHLLFRLRERLWYRPTIACLLSLCSIYLVKLFDHWDLDHKLPEISLGSIESLLTILATSMLTVAALAVTTMVSAYASAGNVATPRSFSLVVADSTAQRALSVFIGTFIFSVVSLISVKNSFFDNSSRFALFSITLFVLALVILTFVHWVDHMARLGRLGTIIKKVESATGFALSEVTFSQTQCTKDSDQFNEKDCVNISCPDIGYLQRIDLPKLQSLALKKDLKICLMLLPGAFIAPEDKLAHISCKNKLESSLIKQLQNCFIVATERTFEADPRFGFVTLSEIASRALSPAINDPGTAIVIIGTVVRLFGNWSKEKQEECSELKFNRLYAPRLNVKDMFEDAFESISRDGAHKAEIGIRLQKALYSLSLNDNKDVSRAASEFADKALKRSKDALSDPADFDAVKAIVDSHS